LTAIRADLALSLVTAGAGKAGAENTPQALRTFLSGTSPAHTVVTIQFGVEQRTHVVLAIYNVAGQRVRMLLAGPVDAGAHSRNWDGRDEHGRDVATGVYIAKLQASDKTLTQKLILTK
jgi:flagellar hook assembly protein FlgD